MAKPKTNASHQLGAHSADHPEELVRISVILSKEERHRLKVVAAERSTTISDIVREGIAKIIGGRTR